MKHTIPQRIDWPVGKLRSLAHDYNITLDNESCSVNGQPHWELRLDGQEKNVQAFIGRLNMEVMKPVSLEPATTTKPAVDTPKTSNRVPNMPVPQYQVIAPAISAEAIIVRDGALVACMSSVGRSREQILEDARWLSFAGASHSALGDILKSNYEIMKGLINAHSNPSLTNEQLRQVISDTFKQLGAAQLKGKEVYQGPLLTGDEAKAYDDTYEHQKPQATLIRDRNVVDSVQQKSIDVKSDMPSI